MPKRKRFSAQIREALLADPRTRYQIAKLAGIEQSVLSRLIRKNKRGEYGFMGVESLDRLAEVLALDVVVRRGAE